MTLDGIVRKGMIVLESGASLPEGTRVKVIAEPAEVETKPTLLGLRKLAGIAKDLPEDFAAERDRKLIERELQELADRDVRMREAADEDTLSGHLRRAIHQSRRPLQDIAREAGISTTLLCDFLEGERTLRSDVLDRLTQAVGLTISLGREKGISPITAR